MKIDFDNILSQTDRPKRTLWFWICHPLVALSLHLDETVFKPETEEQKIAKLMRDAQQQAEEHARVIRDHMFAQHLARSNIKALEDWNHGRNLLCDQGRGSTEGLTT